MGYRVDLTGKRYGRLTVIGFDYERDGRTKHWLCKCDCGNVKSVRAPNLHSGITTSCGCYHKEMLGNLSRTHGLSNKTGRLYPLWKSIKYRCYCKTAKEYKNYGGRGIKMCDEWKNDFVCFYEWAIANGYKEEKTDKGINILTIDRIDVNGNYEPTNCRFITNAEQAKNKRNSMAEDEHYSKCPVCGKTIYQKQRKTRQITCSKECCSIYRKSQPRKRDYTKICPVCGKEFDAQRGGHYKDAICCSRKCASVSFSPIWEFNGEKLRVVEWANKIGINSHCLLHRKEMGWSIEEILTTPLRGKRNANKL